MLCNLKFFDCFLGSLLPVFSLFIEIRCIFVENLFITMCKLPNGLSALLYACLVCFVGLVMPIKALAVSALPATKAKSNLTTRLAHRIVQKRLMRAAIPKEEPCAVLLKKDGTEMFVKIVSRHNTKLKYHLCGDTKKSIKSMPYDSISAVRFSNNMLWRPYGSRAMEVTEGQGNWGMLSLILSAVGLLTLVLAVGIFLCAGGVIVGVIGLTRRTPKRWAAVLGIVLGALPFVALLAVALLLAFWDY